MAQRPAKALLYEIKGCDHPTSYLFGTFHSDSPELAPIVRAVAPYIGRSEGLKLELVLSEQQRQQAQRWLFLPSQSENLEDIVGRDVFEQTKNTLGTRLGVADNVLQRYRPWAIALLAQYPPPEASGIVLDEQLRHIAMQHNVPAQGLETLENQFGIFTRMDSTQQIDFLIHTLNDAHSLDDTLLSLKRHYLAHDIEAIHHLSRELFDAMAQTYPDMALYLEESLIDQRNQRMAEKIAQSLEQSNFIALGALHLPGPKGLFALLEQQGYQLYPVTMH